MLAAVSAQAIGVASDTCPNPDPYTVVAGAKEYTPYGITLVQAREAAVIAASANVAANVSMECPAQCYLMQRAECESSALVHAQRGFSACMHACMRECCAGAVQ